jgi:hypothetical protein
MSIVLRRHSFWIKVVLAAGLLGLCDQLVWGSQLGAGFGLAALAGVAAIVIARPTLRRPALTWTAVAIATALALLEIDNGGVPAFLLFAVAVAVAALSPRAGPRDDVWRWAQRLVMGGVLALWGPIGDAQRLLKGRGRSRPVELTAMLVAALVPVVGGMVFLWLFALANPVLADALRGFDLGEPDIPRIVFAGFVGVCAWGVLRPRGLRRTLAPPGPKGDLDLPGVTTASVTVSLVVFNAVFALQNGLDVVFLWSGAKPPGHVTLADYAHNGAYPLIVTALLTGLFVLVFLRPGSRTGQARAPRLLVTLWVGQNLLLVASCIWRTANYIESYSLTRFRIAALIWMALVGLGLALILWRLLRNKSASWLINANALAAGVVLLGSCAVDFGAVAAQWNVTHARDFGGRGVELDTCYLQHLGGAALVPLAELERFAPPHSVPAKVLTTRHLILDQMQAEQAKWRGWRFRDARRIARMRAMLYGDGLPVPEGVARTCSAEPLPPVASAPQLTAPAQPGH